MGNRTVPFFFSLPAVETLPLRKSFWDGKPDVALRICAPTRGAGNPAIPRVIPEKMVTIHMHNAKFKDLTPHMKITTIIGARPQFIKTAAISRAIAGHNRKNSVPVLEEILVHTGQHYDDDMSAIFFTELEIPEPKYNLNIWSGFHDRQTGRMPI